MMAWRQKVVLLVLLYSYSGSCQVRDLDLDKAYVVVKALIAEYKGTDRQFVSAVLMSPKEINEFHSLESFKGRQIIYTNEDGGKLHGEEMLLKDLDKFKEAYYDIEDNKKQTPILVMYSTYIPCHRDPALSKNTTNCARSLRSRIDGERGSIQLFIAFIGVYSRTVEGGTRVDYTDLNRVLRSFSRSHDICLTYFLSKETSNLESPDSTLKHLDNYKLTSCIDNNMEHTWRLQAKYPKNRPKQTAQETLFKCLMVFVAPCDCISKTGLENAKRIVAFAVNYAFMTCIQEADPGPLSCKEVNGPLIGKIRNKLYKCLSEKWVNSLGNHRSNNCLGDPKPTVRMCVNQAVQSKSVGSPSGDYTRPEWQSEQGTWNIPLPYTIEAFKDIPRSPYNNARCPQSIYKPEFLCTVRETSQITLDPLPAKRRNVGG